MASMMTWLREDYSRAPSELAALCTSELNSCCLEISRHDREESPLSVDESSGRDLKDVCDLLERIPPAVHLVAGSRSSPWPHDLGFGHTSSASGSLPHLILEAAPSSTAACHCYL